MGVLDKKEKKKKRRDDDDLKNLAANSSTRGPVLPTTNGHINLFEDLEQVGLFSFLFAILKKLICKMTRVQYWLLSRLPRK